MVRCMLQGVYSQNRIRQNFAPQQNLGIITPTRAQYPQFKEISPEANSAICAYMSPVINRDTVPQIPLKAMINRLKMQGKIEGKDFIVKKSQNGNIVLTTNNKYGNEEKSIHYDNGDIEHWNYYEQTTYKGTKLLRRISKDNKNRTNYITNVYPKEEVSVYSLAGFKTQNEYMKHLKNNNINFKIKHLQCNDFIPNKNCKEHFLITEYDNNNNKIQSSIWGDTLEEISKFDKHGAESQRITFCDNDVHVTNYIEKYIDLGNFSRKDFPQENFTDEKLTFETTPKDYVSYLKTNNKNYKIYKVNTDIQKSLTIKEFDNKGKEKTLTKWNFDTENPRKLKDIMQEKTNLDGTRTRIVLDKDKTSVEKFTFD